jgi:hypothetical protein
LSATHCSPYITFGKVTTNWRRGISGSRNVDRLQLGDDTRGKRPVIRRRLRPMVCSAGAEQRFTGITGIRQDYRSHRVGTLCHYGSSDLWGQVLHHYPSHCHLTPIRFWPSHCLGGRGGTSCRPHPKARTRNECVVSRDAA